MLTRSISSGDKVNETPALTNLSALTTSQKSPARKEGSLLLASSNYILVCFLALVSCHWVAKTLFIFTLHLVLSVEVPLLYLISSVAIHDWGRKHVRERAALAFNWPLLFWHKCWADAKVEVGPQRVGDRPNPNTKPPPAGVCLISLPEFCCVYI